MGKLKIKDFKIWFEEIEKESHEKMNPKELRKWASAEKIKIYRTNLEINLKS